MSLGLPKSACGMQGDADSERPNFILYPCQQVKAQKLSKPRPFDFGATNIV